MRVLLLSDFFPPTVRGGLEFHVDALAYELAERGHEVHVATLSEGAQARHPNVAVHRIRPAISSFIHYEEQDRPFHPPLPDFAATRQLSRLLEAVTPDVIHGHSLMAVSLPKSRSAPLVFTAHDYALVCQLRTLLRTSGSSCAGPGVQCWSCGSQRYGRAKSALLASGTVAVRSRLNPQALVAVSRAVNDALAPHTQVPMMTIPNFIPDDLHTAARTPSDLPASPYVMYAGDPGDHKGLDILISLWEDHPRPKAELAAAVTKAFDRAVPEGVHIRRWSRPEVLGAWSQAALAVVPSRWPEPLPTVALEAASAGVPLVVSRTGGLVDIVRHGVDGYHVTPGDAFELRSRIDELLGDEHLRASMGAASRERATTFKSSTVVPQIEQLYDVLVRASR